MSSINWLNNFLFVENILGIYRNYCNQTKTKKCFIVIQIFTQIILHSVIVIGETFILLGEDKYSQMNLIYASFTASTFFNAVLSILTGICNSRVFMSYTRSLTRVSERFEHDKKLIHSFKKLHRFSLIFLLLSIAFVVYRSMEVLFNFSDANLATLGTVLVSQTIIRLIIILEHLILFVVILIVVNSLKSFILLISGVQKIVGNCDINSDEQYDITREQIQDWMELYRDLGNCCRAVTLCFGRQFFCTLILSITNYILMVYQMCYTIVIKNGDTDEFRKMVFLICIYVSLLMMPIVAGQLSRNQGAKLHRAVARLYNTMMNDSHEAKAKMIKDLIRLIKKKPIEIKLISKVPAGMYMVPVILTLAVNYFIFMLQFNHII